MSDMRITDVEALYLRMPTIHDRSDSSQDALIVRVTTDAGIVGHGEVDASPLVTKAIIEAPMSHKRAQGLRRLLVGRDPLEISRLWDLMYEGTLYFGRHGAAIHAMAGVDLALWDIKGQALGRPVHELLGGARVDRVRAYASHMFLPTPEETRRAASVARDAGWSAVKFGWEPLGSDPGLDEQLVAAVRGGVGDDVDIMIDAGMAWDAKTAIRRAKLFEPYRPLWLEEPLRPDDIRGYGRLCTAVDLHIAAGEKEGTAEGFRRLMDEGGIDVVQIDVTRVGLSEAVRIASMAADRGLRVANHNFTTDINTAASLHFLSVIPNALMLEYCVEESPMRRSLLENPVEIRDGYAVVPQAPGLGFAINEETVEKYLVRD
jgi:L-alanine-DL-glutamate epimerase-like enolase superfamily enzyme